MRSEPMTKLRRETSAVTQHVQNGNPLALTKNGKECFVIMTRDDYAEYERTQEMIKEEKARAYDEIMRMLDKRVVAYKENPDSAYTNEEMREIFGVSK